MWLYCKHIPHVISEKKVLVLRPHRMPAKTRDVHNRCSSRYRPVITVISLWGYVPVITALAGDKIVPSPGWYTPSVYL